MVYILQIKHTIMMHMTVYILQIKHMIMCMLYMGAVKLDVHDARLRLSVFLNTHIPMGVLSLLLVEVQFSLVVILTGPMSFAAYTIFL